MKKEKKSLRANAVKRHILPRRAMRRLLILGLMLTLCIAALAAGGSILPARVQTAEAASPVQEKNSPGSSPSSGGDNVSAAALQQIQTLMQEKESRTPEQNKIDSQLLHALKVRRGELPSNFKALASSIVTDDGGRTTVDIIADVTDDLLDKLKQNGAEIVVSVPEYRSIRAVVSLDALESIARLPEVTFIRARQEALTNGIAYGLGANSMVKPVKALAPDFGQRAANVKAKLMSALLPSAAPFISAGSVVSEGDRTHRADEARSIFHVDGTGVKIGVLSDGADGRDTAIASGDLPPITILQGQAGFGSEGTALMEIIHDLAPGAQLYFATANNGIASFAKNIKDLRTAGCDIIIDDTRYSAESPFQEGQASSVISNTNGGLVTQAVIDVTTAGAIYFTSAGDDGNKDAGTSGTWEGDFTDGGTMAGVVGRVNDFDSGAGVSQVNKITSSPATAAPIDLFWADPLGGATDDYDLYVLDSTGASVVAVSNNAQTGAQDPFEEVGSTANVAGNQIVIVKFAGANRFLHLATNRAVTQFSTSGAIRGHGLAPLAYSVAATPAVGPYPNPFNSSSVTETFSADGFRRIFFNSNGTAITPNNFSSTGGQVLIKPDITAADGVSVTGVGGFKTPFYGTSAAAAHAAAIAGLMKQAKPSATQSVVRAAIVNSAIDIEAPGTDRDSGAGIIMAPGALQGESATGTAALETGTVVAAETSGNGNGFVEPGESGALTVQLKNVGLQSATGISAVLNTSTPGITITQPNSTYPDLPPSNGAANNNTPFAFTVDPSVDCNAVVNFTLTVTYTGGTSPQTLNFTYQVGESVSLSSVIDSSLPPIGSLFTSTTGTQLGSVSRSGIASSCASAKVFPGKLDSTPRGFDAYTLNNSSGSTICVTIDVRAPNTSNAVQSVTYLGSFDPNNIDQNYLGDSGTTPDPRPYSVLVPANSTFVVVVNEITPGSNSQYTLNITGLPCGAPPTLAAPTNNVPAAQNINEDTTRTFSSGNGNQVSVTDPNGASHQLPVTLYVTAGTLTLPTKTGLTFSVGDGTADQTMSFIGTPSSVNSALNGMIYTPPSNFNGPVTFTIRTGDSSSDTDTVTINIAAVNDAPVNTVPGPQTVTENGTLTFSGNKLISVTDVDAGSNPVKVTLTATNGVINLGATAGLTFTAGGNGTSTMTFTGTITNINNALNNLTYTPTLHYSGPATLQITTDDQGNTGSGGPLSDTDTVSITVTNVNDPPVATADSYSTNEDTTLSVAAPGVLSNDTDIDSPTLTAVLVSGPSHAASFTLNSNGSFSYTPAANYNGADSFTYKANDGSLDSNTVTVSLTVNSVDDAPTADAQSVTTNEDTPKSITLTGSDVDTPAGSLTFTVASQPSHGQLSGVAPNLTYTPAANYNGADSFTFKINDGSLDSNTATVSITISAVNDPPVATADSYSTNEDTPLSVTSPGVLANDTDVDSPTLTAIIVTGPSHAATFNLNADGSFSYTPAANYNGSDSFTYKANDGSVDSNVVTVSITVNAVDDAPQATNDAYSTAENTPLSVAAATGVLANDTDVDGPSLSAIIVSNPLHALSFTLNANGSFSYIPQAGYSGTDSFTYKANDGTLDSNVATVTITVNEGGTFQFSSAAYSVNENVGAATITVTRTGGAAGSASVNFATTNGTATAGSDYTAASGTLNFADGETTKTFNVPIINDTTDEPDETVNLTLSSPGGSGALGSPSTALLTIVDDDPAPTLAINDVSVSEGNSGTANAIFTVTLSQASAFVVKADFATANGTATAGSDYQATSGTVTFNPGDRTQTITVQVNGDTQFEPNETFTVNLTNPQNATFTKASGAGTILDDDAPQGGSFQFSSASYSANEGAGIVTVTVLRAGGSNGAATVHFATSDGTATAGLDYIGVSGTLTFNEGETTKTFVVPVINDTLKEADETINLTLSGAGGAATLGSPATAVLTILDDDSAPSLSINDVSLNEGNAGTTNAVFTVTLSAPSALVVKADFATADGTATAGNDYQSTSGTVTFNPGETTKTVTVLVNGDTLNEPNETFFVNLSNPVNAGLSRSQGTGTILNDDGPTVQFSTSAYTVAEDGLHVVVTVNRVGDTSNASTVDYATSDTAGLAPCNVSAGIASQRCDYETTVGTLRFAAGETSKTIFIPIVDDSYAEGDESFTITLSNPAGSVLGPVSSATITILSNDAGGAANPISNNAFFIRQQYIDFLGREPDPPGFAGWLNILGNCAPGNTSCDRIEVSSDFYRSDEFQTRGYFIYRFYRASLGRIPRYSEFIPDFARVSGFLSAQELEAAKVSFIQDFMTRAEFRTRYDPTLSDPAAYLNLLEQTAGVTLSNKQVLIAGLQNGTETRATVLRKVIESNEVATKFFNEAFVVEAYFGYLRRDPDALFQTWLQLLNQIGDRRALINGFVNSSEYIQRFGQ